LIFNVLANITFLELKNQQTFITTFTTFYPQLSTNHNADSHSRSTSNPKPKLLNQIDLQVSNCWYCVIISFI